MRRLPRKARPHRRQERQHWLEGPPRSKVRAPATAWEPTRQGSRWRAGASRPSAGLRAGLSPSLGVGGRGADTGQRHRRATCPGTCPKQTAVSAARVPCSRRTGPKAGVSEGPPAPQERSPCGMLMGTASVSGGARFSREWLWRLARGPGRRFPKAEGSLRLGRRRPTRAGGRGAADRTAGPAMALGSPDGGRAVLAAHWATQSP